MTPTKRSNGQCSNECSHRRQALGTSVGHQPDCLALYPLQPQPGDEPDTLTKLTRLVRQMAEEQLQRRSDALAEQALALISEAAEERKRLLDERTHLFRRIDAQDTKLAAQQETITALSNKATEALRMGQQQGRVELATELITMTEHNRAVQLEIIVTEDT